MFKKIYISNKFFFLILSFWNILIIIEFEKNRGHQIERTTYVKSLQDLESKILHLKMEQCSNNKKCDDSATSIIKENKIYSN